MSTKQTPFATGAQPHPQAESACRQCTRALAHQEQEAETHVSQFSHGCEASEALISKDLLPKCGWLADRARGNPTEMPECEPHQQQHHQHHHKRLCSDSSMANRSCQCLLTCPHSVIDHCLTVDKHSGCVALPTVLGEPDRGVRCLLMRKPKSRGRQPNDQNFNLGFDMPNLKAAGCGD